MDDIGAYWQKFGNRIGDLIALAEVCLCDQIGLFGFSKCLHPVPERFSAARIAA